VTDGWDLDPHELLLLEEAALVSRPVQKG